MGGGVESSARATGPRPDVAARFAGIEAAVAHVLEGKDAVVRLALLALLSEGHLLIEDVPGVGKTLLAKAVARSLACSVRRVQFTPDLLPSDVTGVTVYNAERGDFEFKPGAVFTNVLLGDEINRAGPKTQSALLEAMEERTVTVDGTTHELGVPFMVIATQNPIELDGTFPLPEAQRDRFLMRISLGYPSADAEVAVLDTHGSGEPLADVRPVADAREVAAMILACRGVHVAAPVKRYLVDLVRATRSHPAVELGASPRASLGLLRASRTLAAVEGRDYVVPDDVKRLAPVVLSHRLVLGGDAQLAGHEGGHIVDELLSSVPIPVGQL
ncbi:MAG: MoxR family ATPase [Actinobacteria bacterium]|nr:MoxR family ATPase [Actinomycetota bacterium]